MGQELLNKFALIFAQHGFLPTRGSMMLDLVTVVMFLVVIVMGFSIHQVRRKRYSRHKKIQLATATALLVSLVAFELDMRFVTDWRTLAEASPYYESGVVNWCLWVHLTFAIPTPLVWIVVIWKALKTFRDGFEQGRANRIHRWSGRFAALMMLMTAVTGWVFYYVAFVAAK